MLPRRRTSITPCWGAKGRKDRTASVTANGVFIMSMSTVVPGAGLASAVPGAFASAVPGTFASAVPASRTSGKACAPRNQAMLSRRVRAGFLVVTGSL